MRQYDGRHILDEGEKMMKLLLLPAGIVLFVGFFWSGCNQDEVRSANTSCNDGERTCLNNDVFVCDFGGRDFGEWVFVKECDDSNGEACLQGECSYPCEAAESSGSSIGCEYYATCLPGGLGGDRDQYALIISNPSTIDAVVTISKNDAEFGETAIISVVATHTIPPSKGVTVPLEWRTAETLDPRFAPGSYLAATPYHIKSNVPIVVQQFAPIDLRDSTDASLLLAVHSLGKKYIVLTYPQLADGGSPFLSVVATEDNTKIVIVPTAPGQDSTNNNGPDVPLSTAGEELTFLLNKGEIVTLFGISNALTEDNNEGYAGSTVVTSAPVAVFSGTSYGTVPSNASGTASHMEEQIFPENTLGKKFVAARTPVRSINGYEEAEYWVLLGTVDGTTVNTNLDPPQDVAIINRGEHVEFVHTGDFLIWSDQPVLLGQFVADARTTNLLNDPNRGGVSFILVSPIEQFLDRYTAFSPITMGPNYLIITIPNDGTIFTLDGILPSSEDCEISDLTFDWTIYRCKVKAGMYHEIQATGPIGLVVYGLGTWASYGHTGGSAMKKLVHDNPAPPPS